MTDWSRISYSTTSPTLGISSRRQAICQTRGQSNSASIWKKSGSKYRSLRTRSRSSMAYGTERADHFLSMMVIVPPLQCASDSY